MCTAMRGSSFAEVRLDALRDPEENLQPLFKGRRRVIATCREGRLHGRERIEVLRRALEAGARCVDVELDTPRHLRAALIASAAPGVEVIVSTHWDHMPAIGTLRGLPERCFRAGAHIAKIACQVEKPRDNAALIGLLTCGERLVVIGMGKRGLPARLLAPLLGSEFTFAAPDGARATAPGQLPFSETLRRMQALRRQLGG